VARVRTFGGALRVQLDEDEAQVMRQVLDEMRALLDGDPPRADPVIARLFPDAYETAREAETYRELVHDELRAGKLRALQTVREFLGETGGMRVALRGEEIEQWLTVLTDVRLAIGTRLEVTEEKVAADIDPEDPEAGAMSVLGWLGWLQQSILEEIHAWEEK
jgi:hypothetical protein